jgi:IclR family transcriptional regulator, acetate operon repressor
MSQTRTGTQAIDRAAELLVRVVESADAPSVGELAEASGLPKSTTSRLVSALERQGLVQRDTGRAALLPGPVLLRYAAKERTDPDLIELASEALDRLAEITGETINLGVATTGVVEQLDQRDSRHYLGSTNWVGKRVPLHASAIGKVFMAFGEIPIPAGPLEQLTARTLVDAAELASDLVVTRSRGYATAIDELEPGLWAIASPVFDAGGSVVAALSVSGPTVRFKPRLLDDFGRDLCRETATLSNQLGYDDITKGAA